MVGKKERKTGRKERRKERKTFVTARYITQKKERYVGYSRFGLVSLFNGISTLVGYLMPKAMLLEEQ